MKPAKSLFNNISTEDQLAENKFQNTPTSLLLKPKRTKDTLMVAYLMRASLISATVCAFTSGFWLFTHEFHFHFLTILLLLLSAVSLLLSVYLAVSNFLLRHWSSDSPYRLRNEFAEYVVSYTAFLVFSMFIKRVQLNISEKKVYLFLYLI